MLATSTFFVYAGAVVSGSRKQAYHPCRYFAGKEWSTVTSPPLRCLSSVATRACCCWLQLRSLVLEHGARKPNTEVEIDKAATWDLPVREGYMAKRFQLVVLPCRSWHAGRACSRSHSRFRPFRWHAGVCTLPRDVIGLLIVPGPGP